MPLSPDKALGLGLSIFLAACGPVENPPVNLPQPDPTIPCDAGTLVPNAEIRAAGAGKYDVTIPAPVIIPIELYQDGPWGRIYFSTVEGNRTIRVPVNTWEHVYQDDEITGFAFRIDNPWTGQPIIDIDQTHGSSGTHQNGQLGCVIENPDGTESLYIQGAGH